MTKEEIISDGPAIKQKRYNMALLILGWGIFGVTALGAVAIIFTAVYSSDADVFGSVKDILAILVPVISAWVGTVLAFYFSKENFESASDKSRELIRQFSTPEEKLQGIVAKDVMIQMGHALFYMLKTNPDQVFLKKDLKTNFLDRFRRNRLPVLDEKGRVLFMLHRSTIDQFLDEMADRGADREKLTLQDMLDSAYYSRVLTGSYKTIKGSMSLLKAKTCFETFPGCQDVFVTETGELTSPVIGWITNDLVIKHSTIE